MQFSNTTDKNGLIQYCEQNLFGDNGFTKISGDADRLKIFTNYLNEGYSRYTELALKSDGRWAFDDSTYTEYAIGTTNLVANQQDYTFEASFIAILSVEIKDAEGNWITLREVDEREYSNMQYSMSEEFKTPSTPYAFNRTANSIFLLPAPNYSITGGLKVKFQRPPNYFTYDDTTQVPGFTETHHPYLANFACMKYAFSRQMPNGPYFKSEVDKAELIEIPAFYTVREKDRAKRMLAANHCTR